MVYNKLMENNARKKRTARRYHKKKMALRAYVLAIGIAVVTVGLVCLIVLGNKAALDEKLSYDRFYNGIYVENVHIGGMTYEQARTAVEAVVDERLDAIRLTLTYGGREWVFDRNSLLSAYNVDTVLTQCYGIGRHGGYAERSAAIDRLLTDPEYIGIDTALLTDALRPELEKIKAEVDMPVVDAAVFFNPDAPDGKKFTYRESQVGFTLDIEALYGEICRAFEGGQLSVSLAVRPDVTEPSVLTSHVKADYGLISSFTTYLSTAPEKADRRFNVHKSSMAFHGLTLMPGEVLSYNRIVGDVTEANGYRPAPVISPDKTFVDEIGGGICQSSTTLFNAAMMADLNVLIRSNHSIPSSYASIGCDAMVSYPYSDLKIRNDSDKPVFFAAETGDDFTRILVYGVPLEGGASIFIDSSVIEELPEPEPQIIVDTENKYNLAPGQSYVFSRSRSYIKAECYKVWVDASGNEIKRETAAVSVYPQVVGITYVSALPSPTPETTPVPDAE